MPRYAKANQTVENLCDLIDDHCPEGYGLIEVIRGKVAKDLSKINADTENADRIGEFDMPGTENMPQYEMLTDTSGKQFPVAWCACGGDWQLPIAFVLYIANDGALRAYIPEDGNAYDHENKEAWMTPEAAEFYCDVPKDPPYKFDANALRADVSQRIVVK